jgi:hypothetical protein
MNARAERSFLLIASSLGMFAVIFLAVSKGALWAVTAFSVVLIVVGGMVAIGVLLESLPKRRPSPMYVPRQRPSLRLVR